MSFKSVYAILSQDVRLSVIRSYLFTKRLSNVQFEATLAIASKDIDLLFGTIMNIKF